jgi:hypothetical protein
MADKHSDNVRKGSGSKSGNGSGSVKGSSRGGQGAPRMSSGDAGASSTEKTHNAEFAKGGDTKMFGEQEAGEQRPGFAEKPDQRGPGDTFAAGGKGKMFGFAGALPATAGISAARES